MLRILNNPRPFWYDAGSSNPEALLADHQTSNPPHFTLAIAHLLMYNISSYSTSLLHLLSLLKCYNFDT